MTICRFQRGSSVSDDKQRSENIGSDKQIASAGLSQIQINIDTAEDVRIDL